MRDRAFVLDRQVRDAAPRIDLVGRREGVGRTGIETASAGAAMVLFGYIGLEREAQIDLAKKQPGAELPRHQIGVLPLPPKPGPLCQRLFHDRGGIDEHLQFARPALGDPASQRLEPLLDRVVVILAAGID